MSARPILFSGAMVRALLAGRKTQTRRVVKRMWGAPHAQAWSHVGDRWEYADMDGWQECAPPKCPYGGVGDRLWVRETFSRTNPGGDYGIYFYRADEFYPETLYRPPRRIDTDIAWTPSIHMPRVASRITLEITGIRVERLFAVTEGDCRAEGMLEMPGGWTTDEGQPFSETARRAYEDLWHSINGAWLDCWVWVIEFKRVTP